MKLTLTARALISVAIGASVLIPVGAQAANSGTSADVDQSTKTEATFEGDSIDLSENWGDAQACWVDDDGNTTCYRTEQEMDAALDKAGERYDQTTNSSAQGARAISCSSSIRLYKNSYYGGSVLYVSQRQTWLTLSWYGFDNSVSSYKVYACGAVFRSGSYGGGSTYWGGTNSWNWRTTMGGWNNVLSSLYIY